MKKLFTIFCLMWIIGSLSAQEPILLGSITATARWYTERSWSYPAPSAFRNGFQGKIMMYGEQVYEVDFLDPHDLFIGLFTHWKEEAFKEKRPGSVNIIRAENRLEAILSFPWEKGNQIRSVMFNTGYGRHNLFEDGIALAQAVNHFLMEYNYNDREFEYSARADIDWDHEEMYWTGIVSESPEYRKCTVVYKIYKEAR